MDFDLSPEHVLLRDTIRDFLANEVAPARRPRAGAALPARDRRPPRRDGLARHPDPRGRGRRGARHARVRDRDRGDRPGLGLARDHRRRAHVARLRPDPPRRLARAEGALPRPDGVGPRPRRVRADRARRRQRLGRHAHDRPLRRRPTACWVIDGGKRFITNAGQAGTYIVSARTGSRDDGSPEISAFIVPADTPGLHASAGSRRRWASTPRRPAS